MKKLHRNKIKVYPINNRKTQRSFSQKILNVIIVLLVLGGYNRGAFFNGKPKIYRIMFMIYGSLFPSIYTYSLYIFLTQWHYDIHYSIKTVVFTIEIISNWLFSHLKGTEMIALLYNNLNLLENRLNNQFKYHKFRQLIIILLVIATQSFLIFYLFTLLFRYYKNITVQLVLDGTVISIMSFVFNLDKIWSYYVFHIIYTTLEAIYKELKSYKLSLDKNIGNTDHFTENRLEVLLEYYKKNVKCQEVLIDIINPMFIITIIMTHIRVGTHLYLAAYSLTSEGPNGSRSIWKMVIGFIKAPQIDMWLLLLLCFEGDKVARLDQKIKIILTDMLVDRKETAKEYKTIQNFLRYIDKKRDKLTMYRIVRLTVELPFYSFLNLIQFFVLVVQFLSILKENKNYA